MRSVLAFALLTLWGCEASETRTRVGNACGSDIECPAGSSCDPWERICVDNTAAADATVVPGADTATEGGRGCHAGDPCDDRDPCTTADSCDDSGACAGAAYSCDDGFDCTVDQCQGDGTCSYGAAANRCFVDGQCYERGAVSSYNACRECNPSVDAWAWTANDTLPCDDGDACTAKAACTAGTCIGGPIINCDDGVACTQDECQTVSGCVSTPNETLCDDGFGCTVDACGGEGCTNTANDALCIDNIGCTNGTCAAGEGCTFTGDDASCDDLDPCTMDACDAETGCQNLEIVNCP